MSVTNVDSDVCSVVIVSGAVVPTIKTTLLFNAKSLILHNVKDFHKRNIMTETHHSQMY